MRCDVFIAFPNGGLRGIDFVEAVHSREPSWNTQLIFLAEEVAMLRCLVPSIDPVRASAKASTALISAAHGLLPPRMAAPFIKKIRMGAAEADTRRRLTLLKIRGPGDVSGWYPEREPAPPEYLAPSPIAGSDWMPEGYGRDRYDTHQWNEIRLWERGWPLHWR